MDETLKSEGFVNMKLIRDGRVIDERNGPNTITKAGMAHMAGLFLTDVGGTAFDYIALGIGTTGATADDTALESEIASGGGERAAATGTRVTTTNTNDTSQLVKTFTFTSSFAVTESGVFNAASTGTMACRQTFTAVNVISGDTLQITWKIKHS